MRKKPLLITGIALGVMAYLARKSYVSYVSRTVIIELPLTDAVRSLYDMPPVGEPLNLTVLRLPRDRDLFPGEDLAVDKERKIVEGQIEQMRARRNKERA